MIQDNLKKINFNCWQDEDLQPLPTPHDVTMWPRRTEGVYLPLECLPRSAMAQRGHGFCLTEKPLQNCTTWTKKNKNSMRMIRTVVWMVREKDNLWENFLLGGKNNKNKKLWSKLFPKKKIGKNFVSFDTNILLCPRPH